jgi:Fic family protein
MSFVEKIKIIDQLNTQIESHGPIDPEMQKKIDYKFRLEWNYNSNIMEGNSLTKQETRSVMVGNITVGGKPLKDVLEMKGHDEVVKRIIKMGRGELNISEATIKEIHKGIMYEESPEDQNKIGVWKTQNNYLYNYKKERVDFVSFPEVKERMHELINWLNAAKEKIERADKSAKHPIVLAFKFHLDYISIHPFYDGNGRTARILTNIILITYGYPPLYIKLDEKDRYYKYLADVQEYGGAPDLFYDFMADILIRSQQLVINALEGNGIEEPDDIDKEIALWKKDLSNISDEPVLKSRERITLLYTSCFSIFLDKYIAKMQMNFQDLFADWETQALVDGNVYADMKDKTIIDRHLKTINNDYNLIAITLFMKGFKKNPPNVFSISSRVEIKFDEYIYMVKLNGSKMTEKLYTQYLSEIEQSNIQSKAVNETFELIKSLMK